MEREQGMTDFQTILMGMEIAGIIAFSISGAMIAIAAGVDVFGVMLLGLITALGGGTLRDTLLGLVPSGNFYNYPEIILSVMTALVVFWIAYTHKNYYDSHAELLDRLNNVVDSIGLGIFSVYGVQETLQSGCPRNFFLAIFMGMITGVGGGIIRDMMVQRMPMVISKHIYAVASLVGSACYFFCVVHGMQQSAAALLGAGLVFVIRMLATKLKLNLPRIR